MSEMASQEPATTTATAPTCRWEYEDERQCTRPPAPRRGTRGPAPVYCEQADGPGQPVHNPLNAWRAKTKAGDTPGQDPQAERAPVATAVKTAGSTLDRAEQLAAALRETTEHLAEALATAADPGAAAAQIQAQVQDADDARQAAESLATRERDARIRAEAQAGAATQMAEAMAGQTEAAQADAEAARADVSAMRSELQEATAAHAAELDRIREETQARITIAEEDRDSAIARRRGGQGRGHRRGRAAREPRAGAGAGGDRAGPGRGRGPCPRRR